MSSFPVNGSSLKLGTQRGPKPAISEGAGHSPPRALAKACFLLAPCCPRTHLNLDALLLLLDRDRNVPEEIPKLGGLPIRTLVADTNDLNYTESLKRVINVGHYLIAQSRMNLSSITTTQEIRVASAEAR